MVPTDEGTGQRPGAIRDFVRELSAPDRMLVTLRDELYGGKWQEMETDLQQRLQGRPYVFKLASRIEDDLARIRKMREFEEANQVNLRDLL